MCELKRLGNFYKWISACRVFRLMEAFHQNLNEIHNLNCVIKRCIFQLLNVLKNIKIMPQKTPISELNDQVITDRGFPYAKKNLILQLIKMFTYSKNFNESNK